MYISCEGVSKSYSCELFLSVGMCLHGKSVHGASACRLPVPRGCARAHSFREQIIHTVFHQVRKR